MRQAERQWRRTARMATLLAGLALAGCAERPAATLSTTGPSRAQVEQAMAQWPSRMHRTFFATIHAAGHRIAASGVFDARSPRDFRITAVTEVGNILFDVRFDWAGVHVIRVMPGLPESIVEAICRDISLAMRAPGNLADLRTREHDAVLKNRSAEGYQFTYTFDAKGRVTESRVEVGTFDTLTVKYERYDEAGRPVDVTMQRPMRAYTMALTLMDS